MKHLLLSLLAVTVSTPAFAHVQDVPRAHGSEIGVWSAMALIAAAITVGALRKRN